MHALDVFDSARVDVGDFAPAISISSEGFEFGQTDRAGDVVHAVVETDCFVVVLVGFSM